MMTLCESHDRLLRTALDEHGVEGWASPRAAEVPDLFDVLDPAGATLRQFTNKVTAYFGPVGVSIVETSTCAVCALNSMHDSSCQTDGCTFSFDQWIHEAVTEMVCELMCTIPGKVN